MLHHHLSHHVMYYTRILNLQFLLLLLLLFYIFLAVWKTLKKMQNGWVRMTQRQALSFDREHPRETFGSTQYAHTQIPYRIYDSTRNGVSSGVKLLAVICVRCTYHPSNNMILYYAMGDNDKWTVGGFSYALFFRIRIYCRFTRASFTRLIALQLRNLT